MEAEINTRTPAARTRATSAHCFPGVTRERERERERERDRERERESERERPHPARRSNENVDGSG